MLIHSTSHGYLLCFTMATVAFVVAVVANLLSTTLILDLAALWPAIALALIMIPVALLRRGPWRWAPPMILLTWLLSGLGLHLNAVSILPSAVGDIEIGVDASNVGTAKLTAGPIEVLVVDFSGGETLTSVTMRRRGGGVAPAVATPRRRGDSHLCSPNVKTPDSSNSRAGS